MSQYHSKLDPEDSAYSRRKANVVAALQPVSAPVDEAKLRKMLAMIMAAKEAHAEGAHEGEGFDDFCPECKRERRAEIQESAERAVFTMGKAERLADLILRHPEEWEEFQAWRRSR